MSTNADSKGIVPRRKVLKAIGFGGSALLAPGLLSDAVAAAEMSSYGYIPGSPTVGEQVEVFFVVGRDNLSTDPSAPTTLTYNVYWGDGATDSQTVTVGETDQFGPQLSFYHSYSAAGTYTIQVEGCDSIKCESGFMSVTVSPSSGTDPDPEPEPESPGERGLDTADDNAGEMGSHGRDRARDARTNANR